MELLKPLSNPDFAAQTAAYTGTAANTTGWSAGPQGVLVWSDQPCYVEVGEGAVATTASTPIPAYTPVPFAVPLTVTGVWRVSAIAVSSSGTIYTKPINKQ